jgi:ADP-ribose pyrophosphatase YjhB (NUDIX family)
MKKNRIRPIAIGLFLHNDQLLVFEGYDQVKEKAFFRPLGGAIKFGETGAEALKREIQEEIGQEIENILFQGMIESRFMLRGEPGHEIVLVYSGRFVDESIYSRMNFTGHEDDGSEIKARWMDLDYFSKNAGLLVPPELSDILARLKD